MDTSSFLTHKLHFRIAQDDDLLHEFERLAAIELPELLAAKEAQHFNRPRYTAASAWRWFNEHCTQDQRRRYRTITTARGKKAGDLYVKDVWEKAFPQRPPVRPTGLLTNQQVQAIAYARALRKLLDKNQ